MTDPHLAFAAERHGFHVSAKIEVTAIAIEWNHYHRSFLWNVALLPVFRWGRSMSSVHPMTDPSVGPQCILKK
jgi:hypothetical protein